MSPYIEYESPVSYGRKVMCRVKVFSNVGHGQGLVIKNTPAQYESAMSNGKKVMCRVKVF